MRELEAELADAERCAIWADSSALPRSGRRCSTELEGAARGRRPGSHAERARVAVTKAIKAALERIAKRHPELGTHLSATIRRGYVCAYVPDPRVPVEWEV